MKTTTTTTTERTKMATATKTAPAGRLAPAEEQHQAAARRLVDAQAELARLLTAATTAGAVTPTQLTEAEAAATLGQRALLGAADALEQARTAAAAEEADQVRKRIIELESPDQARRLVDLYDTAVTALTAFVTAVTTTDEAKAGAARRLVELAPLAPHILVNANGWPYMDGLPNDVNPTAADRRNLALDAAVDAMSTRRPYDVWDLRAPGEFRAIRNRAEGAAG